MCVMFNGELCDVLRASIFCHGLHGMGKYINDTEADKHVVGVCGACGGGVAPNGL